MNKTIETVLMIQDAIATLGSVKIKAVGGPHDGNVMTIDTIAFMENVNYKHDDTEKHDWFVYLDDHDKVNMYPVSHFGETWTIA